MKLLVIAIFCLNVLQVFCRDKEKEREMAAHLLAECKAKEGASDVEYENLIREQLPETTEGRCMVACAYETVGLFTDGKFNRDTFLQLAKMVVENDPEAMVKAGVIADDCGEAGGERCEVAFTFTKCLHDAIKKFQADVQIF